MPDIHNQSDWASTAPWTEEIDTIRTACRQLVRRRALLSAGVAAIPLPLIDVAIDTKMLASLIDDINTRFNLTSEQINHLRPESKMFSFTAVAGVGSAYIGRLATRQLAAQMLKRTGVKTITKNVPRLVPIAGQLISAMISFAAFRSLGYQHIDICVQIATQLALPKNSR